MDKAGTSGYFDGTEEQQRRYATLRQKTEKTKFVDGLTPSDMAGEVEVRLPICCMGKPWLVYCVGAFILITPLVMCGFMMNATYTAYHYYDICTGPELTGGVLQSIWYLAFFWIVIWSMLKGLYAKNKDQAEQANCCIILPFILIAVACSSPLLLVFVDTSSSSDGEGIIGLFIFMVFVLTLVQLCLVALWPFLVQSFFSLSSSIWTRAPSTTNMISTMV